MKRISFILTFAVIGFLSFNCDASTTIRGLYCRGSTFAWNSPWEKEPIKFGDARQIRPKDGKLTVDLLDEGDHPIGTTVSIDIKALDSDKPHFIFSRKGVADEKIEFNTKLNPTEYRVINREYFLWGKATMECQILATIDELPLSPKDSYMTADGSVYKLVKNVHPLMNPAYRGPDGTIWGTRIKIYRDGDPYSTSISYLEAKRFCEMISVDATTARLPAQPDYSHLTLSMCGETNKFYCTPSLVDRQKPALPEILNFRFFSKVDTWIFNGSNYIMEKWDPSPSRVDAEVLCVLDPEKPLALNIAGKKLYKKDMRND